MRIRLAAALVAAVITASPEAVASADDHLTLRVNDTKAEPGGIAEVVVRTYSPRGLEQGEICLSVGGGSDNATMVGALLGHKVADKAADKALSGPLVTLEAVAVFSSAGDAVSDAVFDAAGQTAMLRFSSPTATVNQGDGPLAIFYFRLSDRLEDGQRFYVNIDYGGTYVIDADGVVVEIEPKGGRLEVDVDEDNDDGDGY